jgi:hypothetical protein
MSRTVVALIFAASLAAPAMAQPGAPMPRHVGQCVVTRVKSVETRLVDGSNNTPIPGSGSAISFVNGGYQVSYDTVPAVEGSRTGDPVRVCLIAVPRHCPRGDDRGRLYRTTNLRTHRAWTLRDAEHMCGGA